VRYVRLMKGQEYSHETNPTSRQRGCYIRTITTRAQLGGGEELGKGGGRSLVESLKRLDAKTN
jgi:hypothetical protein